jgi:hypothetical protein
VYQGSHIYYWIRAEGQYTCIASTTARYNEQELAEFSANATYAAGNMTLYSDTEWVQVGQTKPPLHPTNSRSLGDYGNSTKLVQNNCHTKTLIGDIVNNAAKDYAITAGNSIAVRGNSVSVNSTGTTAVHSANYTSVRGQSQASLSSSGPVNIDGSMVFINCRKSKPPAPAAPAVISDTPRSFENMKDIAEYPRDNPIAPTKRSVRGITTPEPGSTPVNTDIGQWTTKHS